MQNYQVGVYNELKRSKEFRDKVNHLAVLIKNKEENTEKRKLILRKIV